ncbi:MAG TPA: isocitrate lyase/PEP mutase family protein [Mycobacteriales bacterium]|jgi:2-methylisocitrate lyase-like PEP mutase family enzyme|nr:isocitrate lyase/PEP mutase family protein [Mycobacteriales bacterium]
MGSFVHPPTGAAARLRRLLAADRPVLVPGAYDALSARLVEAAGFDAAYMTGFGTTASLLGMPDVGLLSQAEMVDNAGRMARAVDVPLISDADTGYGNAINVARTVQQFERAGVAAIHLEDQVSPKRCGHMSGKQVVPVSEMVEKLHAAVAARVDPDFVLIARTDARAVDGLDAALARAQAYLEAGADVLFVEAPESESEIEAVAAAFPDTPLLFNWVERGRTPMLPLPRIAELGFALVLFPVATLFSATTGMQRYLAQLRATGTPLAALDDAVGFDEFTDLVGLPEIRAFEADLTA